MAYHRCKCYLERNYYIETLKSHLKYTDIVSLIEDGILGNKKADLQEEEINDIIETIEKERKRREEYDKDSKKRRMLIQEKYKPLHSHLCILQETFFTDKFLEIVNFCKSEKVTLQSLRQLLHEETSERVYSFKVFTEVFCQKFIEEIEHFEKSDLPKGRPNTMNNYGVLLEEMGWYDGFINPLRENYLLPICQVLYPDLGGGHLDSQKAFIVTYKLGEDLDLDSHYDNAEITINISLGKEFEGGSLFFGKMRNEMQCDYTECLHRLCYGILHRGQHIHGALPIDNGERYNIIVWMRSSQIRNKLCPMCDCVPELIPATGFGDGFTRESVDVCQVI